MVKSRFDWVFNFFKELDEWVKFGSLKFLGPPILRVHKLNPYPQILLNEKKRTTLYLSTHQPFFMVSVGASSLWVKVVVWMNRGKDIWGPSYVGPLPTKIILSILKKINVLTDHKASKKKL